MAPPELWKDYFNNPTLSDLTIRLSDRLVHVHRVVLCRGSAYFEKLITGSFKESGAKEIELHDDDPVAMTGALRYIYGLDYDKSHVDAVGERQFLAAMFVTAGKYQLTGLENKTYEDLKKIVTAHKLPTEDLGAVDDFLNAVETVLAGTTRECRVRKLMTDYYFWNLPALSAKPDRLSDLLAKNPELSVEITTRPRGTYNPFEGSWYCDEDNWHPDAQPCCYVCEEPFSKQYVLSHRNEEVWYCEDCDASHPPQCFDFNCTSGSRNPVTVEWVWETEYREDQAVQAL